MDACRLESHEIIGWFPRSLVPGAWADSLSCVLLMAASQGWYF